MRVLLLGGTTEAGQLAAALAAAGIDAVYSYAGRTAAPAAQPIPHRVGGFGGAAGLELWLQENRVTHVIDATHPFAARISQHAATACAASGVPLIGFARPPWVPVPGDRWLHVPGVDRAVEALPAPPAAVFLAIGRQDLTAFAARPQHRYLLRLVDPAPAQLLPGAEVVVARGPFTLAGDLALMQRHGTELVVAKNAGGEGARAKLDAARSLGLPVIMIDRPTLPDGRTLAGSVPEVMAWLMDRDRVHPARLGV